MEEKDNTASSVELMRNSVRESVIAVLPPGEQLEDARIAALAALQRRHDLLEQLLHRLRLGETRSHEAARR